MQDAWSFDPGKSSHSESNHAPSKEKMPTAAMQTQRLTWTLTDICGSISKGGNGRRERGGEKGRTVLAAHTHTMQCALA